MFVIFFSLLLCLIAVPSVGQDEFPLNNHLAHDSSICFQDFRYSTASTAPYDVISAKHSNPLIPGCYPDPSICRVGHDYYMVNSSFAFYPGIPIHHSRDLIHWKQLGHVLNRPSQLDIKRGTQIKSGIYAPVIRYNPYNQLFYVITTNVHGGGNFYVTTSDPKKGNWSDPVYLPEVTGIDPSLFFDEDGKAYIVHNSNPSYPPLYKGHKAIWCREFDWKIGQTVGEAKQLIDAGTDISTSPIWIEGPHLYKINGEYFLMAAEGGTSTGHSEVIFRAPSPMGVYEPCPINPILTQRNLPSDRPDPVTCTGHADLIQTPDGDWFAVFLGVRPYRGNYDILGRETFILPVTWNNGQPIILPEGEPIHYQVHTERSSALWTSKGLSSSSFFIRTPNTDICHLDRKGRLYLKPTSERVDEGGSPAAIGRWITQNEFEAVTTLYSETVKTGCFAGMLLFKDDKSHICAGIGKDRNGQTSLQFRASYKGKVITRSEQLVRNLPEKLKIKVKGTSEHQFEFYYSDSDTDKWKAFGNPVSMDYLSTSLNYNYTGTMVGIYATSSGLDSDSLSLKRTYADKFLIGAAVSTRDVNGKDTLATTLLQQHFNCITPENCMKSALIHPEENSYNFEDADAFVEFGEKHGMIIIGHCLVWHTQCPAWFFVDENGNQVSPQILEARLKEHIYTVVGRYKGRIHGWDVVNEAILEDGSYRKSKFYEILGKDYIPLAFKYAHEADPEAELYYNDYGMSNKGRRKGVLKLISQLKELGIPIRAVGMQTHIGLEYPSLKKFEESMLAFRDAGVKVMITEWDQSALPNTNRSANVADTLGYQAEMNPYVQELPDSVSVKWNDRMEDFFDLFVKHSDFVTRVTTWGIYDKHSWKNNFPIKGRKDYPLLFDRKGQPKPVVRKLCRKRL